MNSFVQKLVTLYSANGKFHSFVVALEVGASSGLTSYGGGLPTNKASLIAAGLFVGGFIWGSVKGWLRNNVAIASVQGTGATKTQAQAVAATAAVNSQK
ncbi:MAG TPA: hypothetical protein VN950_22850 [Terriglobales bacterium]|nr:hypothetical protein [Terriglobales bacterium]